MRFTHIHSADTCVYVLTRKLKCFPISNHSNLFEQCGREMPSQKGKLPPGHASPERFVTTRGEKGLVTNVAWGCRLMWPQLGSLCMVRMSCSHLLMFCHQSLSHSDCRAGPGSSQLSASSRQGLLQHVGWQRYWLHCCPPFPRKLPGQNRTLLLLQCINCWKNWRAEALTRRESIYPKKPGTTIWNFTELEVHKIEEGRRKTERNHSSEHIMNEKLLKTAVVKALL